MRFINVYLLLAVVSFVTVACDSRKGVKSNIIDSYEPQYIDIRSIEYSENPLPLSLFVDSIEYIRIEDDPLIPDLWNVHINEDENGCIYLDAGFIYKYDSNGNFIKSLYNIGQGAEEVTVKNQPSVFDVSNNLVYVPNNGIRYNVYTLDGEYIGMHSTQMDLLRIKYLSFWSNSLVYYYYNNKIPKKGDLVNLDSTFFLQVKNTNNDIIYQLPNYHYDIKATFSGNMAESAGGPVQVGIMDDSLFWMKPNYVDTIYSTKNWEKVFPYYIFQKNDNVADYAWSVKARVGDIGKSDLVKEFLGNVCPFENGVLFNYVISRDKKGTGFCPANGMCELISEYYRNDIDNYLPALDLNKKLSYGTYYQKGNYMYVLVDAYRFFEEKANPPFMDLKEDSNPVLVKLRLK